MSQAPSRPFEPGRPKPSCYLQRTTQGNLREVETQGNLHEVVVLDDEGHPVAIHAMALRPKFYEHL